LGDTAFGWLQAAHAGNLSACVCVAQILDGRGDTAAALKLWGKAGKLGHPEAQFRLGRVRCCLKLYKSMLLHSAVHYRVRHSLFADIGTCQPGNDIFQVGDHLSDCA